MVEEMKDNTLREKLNDILAKAVVGEHYILVNANGTKTIDLARKRIETLLAEEVRKARIDLFDDLTKLAPITIFEVQEWVRKELEQLEKEGK